MVTSSITHNLARSFKANHKASWAQQVRVSRLKVVEGYMLSKSNERMFKTCRTIPHNVVFIYIQSKSTIL